MAIKAKLQTGIDLVDRVKTILGVKDLTLHQVSRRSSVLYGGSSHDIVPHGLYRELRIGAFSPSLHQVCALSRISGYELFDWLRVFGFDLDGALRLQILLPSKRTVLLNPSFDNRNSWIPWFQDALGRSVPAGIIPLGQVIEFSRARGLRSLSETNTQGSIYAKIGRQDALAFPDLLPGSIVRVNPEISANPLTEGSAKTTGRIFLIEHNRGLWCSQLHWLDKNRIIPLSNQLPYAHIELRIPSEARILGVVDMEIQRMGDLVQPEVPKDMASRWVPEKREQRETGLGALLRRARGRAALSFREASTMSRRVADLLGDEHYFAAAGSLSDYEAQDTPPRHIHKVLTLCLLYGVRFSEFLSASGINLADLGQDAIPSRFMPGPDLTESECLIRTAENPSSNPTLDSLLAQCGELPFFLRNSLGQLSGIKNLSLRDFFWAGADSSVLHPYLKGGLLLIVNRHKKKTSHLRSMPLWQQPLYLLHTRDGGYICACCNLEDGELIVHSYSTNFERPELSRHYHDAEVVGQVVAIARRPS